VTTLRSLPHNKWELQARAAKANAIVNVLDACAVKVGLCPHRDAEAIAARVSSFTKQEWVAVCRAANENTPSELTISAILRIYIARAEALRETKVA
jgi:hypothetical protein